MLALNPPPSSEPFKDSTHIGHAWAVIGISNNTIAIPKAICNCLFCVSFEYSISDSFQLGLRLSFNSHRQVYKERARELLQSSSTFHRDLKQHAYLL